MEKTIFHVDVNSAFLAWTAVYQTKVLGQRPDLRELPAAIAGSRENRHGIILAKSLPAKRYGVRTGEPIFQAQKKCPGLMLIPPDYALYRSASKQFTSLLRRFSPLVEQYSIDEAWVDMTGTEGIYGPPRIAAERLKTEIRETLGFTVNIGISSNKLLAKMAGDFEKPDKIHTLFPDEIEEKLWPLPVRALFMVGPATERKLFAMGIRTVGQLADADPAALLKQLGKPGLSLWRSANGKSSDVLLPQRDANQCYGNSVTLPDDITKTAQAYPVLLALCETVGTRMRHDGKSARCVAVTLRTADFHDFSHQITLQKAVMSTERLFQLVCQIFGETWDTAVPLRQLGVSVSRLEERGERQYDLFSLGSGVDYSRKATLDNTVDDLREKYGEGILRRARLVGTAIPSLQKSAPPGFRRD